MSFNLKEFTEHIDKETGAILFTKKGFRGIPDEVYNGDGFNIEMNNGEVVMIEIYDPQVVLTNLLKLSGLGITKAY